MTTFSAPDSNSYLAIFTTIIQRFMRLVGAPAALSVARTIPGLVLDEAGQVLEYDARNPLASLVQLIDGYESVYAQVARQPGVVAPPITGPLRPLDQPLRILLVDDHSLFREGLASLLSAQPDMRVIGQASSVREAVALAGSLQPELVLMDFTLPDGTGTIATHAILAEQPDMKIVFLTIHEDEGRLFEAIRAGAMGYLYKNVRATELLRSLRAVARGEAGVSGAIARRILDEFSRLPAANINESSPPATMLTTREVEIVGELASGATNVEIAQRLVISENTVKNHVRNVLAKLHLSSRREVAQYARERGLSPPEDD